MKKKDYVFTYKFLNQYGKAVVKAIKARIKADKLIDTGALYASINYFIKDDDNKFQVIFQMGDGEFKYGSGLPSEYGAYQDQGTIYIHPHYFFTAPVKGLTERQFRADLKKAMAKDIEVYLQKQFKK